MQTFPLFRDDPIIEEGGGEARALPGFGESAYGRLFPTRDLACLTSVALIVPSGLISSRKFGTGHWHADLMLRLSDVENAHRLIGFDVSDQHVRTHFRVWQRLRSAAGYVVQRDGDLLHISDARQVCRHGVARKDGVSENAA